MQVMEETNANQSTKIEVLEETVQVLQEKNAQLEALNSTLANMQGMEYPYIHLHPYRAIT